ncbi:hypothetical protein [Bradyrhizobium sp. AZCC 1610]|uniref:hypothetical protein n=1 Tax=Bradyrhizobium sp. AZCC 1610 TaxID=3117020 RepID=UPI002FEF6870
MLTLMLSLCSSGALQANPLDSPGVVYIDGLPCNRACQSYMAWSDRALSARHREKRETSVVVPAEAEIERLEPAARPRVARQPAAVSSPAPRAGIAASNAKTLNTKASHTRRAATNAAYPTTRKEVPVATATATREKAVEKTVAGTQEPERQLKSSDGPEPGQAASIAASQPTEAPKSEVKSEVKSEAKPEVTLPPPATLEIAAPPATSETAALPATAADAPALAPRTIQQQVVEATGMADLVTAIGTGREAANKSDNPGAEAGEANDSGKTASGSTDSSDNLVALVLARPEINSLSDLNNKNIAIEEKQSASSGRVSAALMAAGAAEVQFSEVKAGAIERLISGEVPAAVLTLASREAAEWFPDIEGFRTFRVPLTLKARL